MRKGSFSSLILHLHPTFVPEGSARVRFTWCLGGLSLLMFCLEALSGVYLMLHYVPVSADAYLSVADTTYIVPYGFFVRNLHYWCGQAMVILVVLHMARVFLTGSYSGVRSFNWVIGVLLLGATFLVDFTGYLLVWDDRGLWARTIAVNLLATIPAIGDSVGALFLGSPAAPDGGIVRIYVWHAFFLPVAMIALMAWHFWRIRKDGGISRPL